MSPADLQALVDAEAARRDAIPHRIAVCVGAGCLSLGSDRVKAAFERTAHDAGAAGQVEVFGTGCLGPCHGGPMVRVESRGADGRRRGCLYERVDAVLAGQIVRAQLAGADPVADRRLPADDPFLARQTRVVLQGSGRVDPGRIESALAAGAYAGLRKALAELTPAEVVAEITASGLRGRGGAGFPTGVKWSAVAKADGEKIVVCNADEGDPGAFMDRSVLEGDPHRVLEGMAIAAYAVGASRGYVYVRGEYPLAIDRLRTAVQQAEVLRLLGSRILDSALDFRVDVRLGAGAYVCGEETALLASIKGKRGTPRPRPPYPAERGLWGLPTLINNVETFANVPTIVLQGAGWFAGIGTERSKGTKVFGLAGKVARPGLLEVPMGTTLREIVFELGGGIPGGRRFKAAQTGGPAGGCIPAHLLDLPVEYEAMTKVGSFLGSGGLIVLDDSSCMVDLARFFMEFCREESCGKCVPCRAGTVQLHRILDGLTHGEGRYEDLDRLEELSELLEATSLCGLGQGAPHPVRSTLRYFRDEYFAHAVERRCPAGVCPMGRPRAAASAPAAAATSPGAAPVAAPERSAP